jgi:hypothetical protein
MKTLAISLLISLCACVTPAADITSEAQQASAAPDDGYCTYEDGIWSCGDPGTGGGGGGGGTPGRCEVVCDNGFDKATKDAFCRSTCGSLWACGVLGTCEKDLVQ